MDPFLIYLLAANVVTFIVFTLDYFLCSWKPEIEDSMANALIIDLLPFAGGAVGALVALFVFTGMGGGHHMNKRNIVWWFTAIIALVVWALVVAAKLGFVAPDTSIGRLVSGWDLGKLKILGIYLAVINVVTLVVFVRDKIVAARGNDGGRRTPEAVLLGLSLAGGAVGGLLGMFIARHKTKKWYFVWGLPAFILLDAVLVLFAHMSGLI